MFQYVNGSHCAFPRQPYSASELPAEYHEAVWKRMYRCALRDITREAQAPDIGRERIATEKQRQGLRERAEEAASECYAEWSSLREAHWCARGDHTHAVAGVIRMRRRSGWRSRTGAYRAANRERAEGMLRWREVRLQSQQDSADRLATIRERVRRSPYLSRFAKRIAPGGDVDALLREIVLAELSERGAFAPGPMQSEPIPCPVGAVCRLSVDADEPEPISGYGVHRSTW